MAKATITAFNKKYTTSEGQTATSEFKFSQPLDNSADVVVRLTGIGAQKDKDFGALKYEILGVSGSTVVILPKNAGTITLPKGSTGLKLMSDIKADSIAGEQNESLVFSVQQAPSASKVLENSYYVTSTTTIQEKLSLAKISVDTDWYSKRVDSAKTGLIDSTVASTANKHTSVVEYVATAAEKFTFQETEAGSTTNFKYAVGAFKLSTKLDKEAVISVKVEGMGADLTEDTVVDASGNVVFEYLLNAPGASTSWAAVPANGRLTLKHQTEGFQLRVALKGDNVTEQQTEKLNFKVAQVSGNLKDSYYVNVETEVVDRAVAATAATTFSHETVPTAGEVKNGTAGQDIFKLYNVTYDAVNGAPTVDLNANSLPFDGKFDTISGFGEGDQIKLSDSVQRYSIGEVKLSELIADLPSNIGITSPTAEQKLLYALNEVMYDGNFPNGAGSILKIVDDVTATLTAGTVYLLIDTNANGVYNTRDRDYLLSNGTKGNAGGVNDLYDTLIKVTGSAGVSDLITGESFITE